MDDEPEPIADSEPEDHEESNSSEELESSSADSSQDVGAGPGLGALNSFFGSDFFKSNSAFDELFKSGGAWNAMMSDATKGIYTPKFLAMLDTPVSGILSGAGSQAAQRIIDQFGSIDVTSISKNLAAGAALNYPSYRPSPGQRGTAYSAEMKSPSDYFGPWEGVIENFTDLQMALTRIFEHHPGSTFLWRGQQDAAWPLHSSLFRRVWQAKGVRDPDEHHRSSEPFPTDQDLRDAENRILSAIREQWGFEDTSALSTFARLQHFGAPTRLLDVSRNPLIAAWFATEKHAVNEVEEADARLFALATTRVATTDEQALRDTEVSRVDLDTASAFKPFWDLHVSEVGVNNSGFGEWGTGRIRRYWIPPHYETRIAAQNAAFVLDGVPVESPDLDKYYKKGGGREGSWRLADRLAAASISVRFSHPSRGAGSSIAAALPPSYTFRITAEGKQKIRKEIEERYSYNKSTIYPDIQGAAQAIRNDPGFFR